MRLNMTFRACSLLVVLASLAAACGGDPSGPWGSPGEDAGFDVAVDTPAWDMVVPEDLRTEVMPDVFDPDALPDATPDSSTDVPGDVAPDAPQDITADIPFDTPPDLPADVSEPCDPNPCPDGAPCHLGPEGPLCTISGAVVEEFLDADMAAQPTTAAWGDDVLTVDLESFGGDGADGAFHATQNTLIDTAANGGVFHYTSFIIDPDVEVKLIGPNPFTARVIGDVEIHGWLRADGQQGVHAASVPSGPPPPPGGVALMGGLGGPGGGGGGDSGAGWGETGVDGAGPGGGGGGADGAFPNGAGAGGGGFGSAGDDGLGDGVAPGLGGPVYGDPTLAVLQGGSGGGGGGGGDVGGDDGTCLGCGGNCYQGACQGGYAALGDGALNDWDRPGGSGGGGGGGIGIYSEGDVVLSGRITADGGNGGWGDWSGAGGGGSGGAVLLSALGEVFIDGGAVSAVGGRGGLITNSNQKEWVISGDGGGGTIRIESAGGLQAYLLNPDPPPSFGSPAAPLDGGTGVDGAFTPAQDVVLDTDAGPYEFTLVNIPAGVTVTAKGSLPLELLVQGGVDIDGDIVLDGVDGGNGYSACCGNPYGNASAGEGGERGPGGFDGGAGGGAGAGWDGGGPGGGTGGSPGSFSSGGGAGYGTDGQNGGTNQCSETSGPDGGVAYGDELLVALEGGSGGGGAGDAVAAACTWCGDGACIVTGTFSYGSCPANPPACSYCPNVPSACLGTTGCFATEVWNPGSGGGGGGGALRIETPGQIEMTGDIHLDGGDGGDNMGASDFDDGTCGPACEDGCADGVCNPSGGGSFGGSGGGGSGGALLIRAAALRATGSVTAVGGITGILSQGGGCPVNPAAKDPVPGQGRGGSGADGRIRIETQISMGAILIGDGVFDTTEVVVSAGGYAESRWYVLPHPETVLTGFEASGLGPADSFEVRTAPEDVGDEPAPGTESAWSTAPGSLPPGAFVSFRIQLDVSGLPDPVTVVEAVTLSYQVEVAP
ncbi:MAG: hypothetical protein ABIK09_20635 [Pseudomonadota bacterium]